MRIDRRGGTVRKCAQSTRVPAQMASPAVRVIARVGGTERDREKRRGLTPRPTRSKSRGDNSWRDESGMVRINTLFKCSVLHACAGWVLLPARTHAPPGPSSVAQSGPRDRQCSNNPSVFGRRRRSCCTREQTKRPARGARTRRGPQTEGVQSAGPQAMEPAGRP